MRYRTPGLKSTSPKASGVIPAGLSGRDMAWSIVGGDDYEDGEVRRGRKIRWTGIHDDLDLAVAAVPPWHRDAICADPAFADVQFFDGPKGKARQLCSRCPVREECLDEALSAEAVSRLCFGIRGGLSGTERKAIIRQGRDEHGTIYFGWGGGLIKIGTTRLSPDRRARVLDITLLATEPGSYSRERDLHRRFAPDCAHGEWFQPSDRLLDYIAGLPDQIVTAGAPILHAVAS